MDLDIRKKHNFFKKYAQVKSILFKGNLDLRTPKISIVIPTYKRSKLLKETIESALGQKKILDYEVVVVDNEPVFDVKTDTEKLIDEYNDEKLFYYKNEENIGMMGNFNRCIELARGEYLTILNDDDLLDLNYLEEANKRIDGEKAIYFAYRVSDEREKSNLQLAKKNSFKKLIRNSILNIFPKKQKLTAYSFFVGYLAAGTLGILYKKANIIELGGFNDEYFPISDFAFNASYVIKYGGISFKLKLMTYRIASNESLNVGNRFPGLCLNLRRELIDIIGKYRTVLEDFAVTLYDLDRELFGNFWNIEVRDELEGKVNRNTLRYRIKKKIVKMYLFIYFLFYYDVKD